MLHDTIKQVIKQRSLLARTLYPCADNMLLTGKDSTAQANAYAQLLAGKHADGAIYSAEGDDFIAPRHDEALLPADARIYVIHDIDKAQALVAPQLIRELVQLYDSATIILSGDKQKIGDFMAVHPELKTRFFGAEVDLDPAPITSTAATPAPPKASR